MFDQNEVERRLIQLRIDLDNIKSQDIYNLQAQIAKLKAGSGGKVVTNQIVQQIIKGSTDPIITPNPIVETPSGLIDGSNKVFTLSKSPVTFQDCYIVLLLNGIPQIKGTDYILSGGNRITYIIPPAQIDYHWVLYVPTLTGPNSRPPALKYDVYGTGIYDDYTKRGGGQQDPHWRLITSPDSRYTGPLAYVGQSLWVGLHATLPDSQWISIRPDMSLGSVGSSVAGSYFFTQYFDLTGFTPGSAVITGNVAADEQAKIYMNGTLVFTGANPAYNNFQAFTINTNFIAGINELKVEVVEDTTFPVGFQMEITSATG